MRKGERGPSPKMSELSPGTRSVLQRFIKASKYGYRRPAEYRRRLGYLLRRLIRLEAGIKHSGRGRKRGET